LAGDRQKITISDGVEYSTFEYRYPWASAAERAVDPLDFQTWYKYSVDRDLKVLFFGLFLLFFSFFSVGPTSWKIFCRRPWLPSKKLELRLQL